MQRKHHGHGALGDTGPVGFCGGVGHQDSPLGCRIHIYVIHSNGTFGNDSQIRRAIHDLARNGAALDGATGEGISALCHFAHFVFVITLGRLPRCVAINDSACLFQYVIGLIGRAHPVDGGENKNLGFRHHDVPSL